MYCLTDGKEVAKFLKLVNAKLEHDGKWYRIEGRLTFFINVNEIADRSLVILPDTTYEIIGDDNIYYLAQDMLANDFGNAVFAM